MYQHQANVPDSTVRPVYPTYLSEWLDKLGAYDTWDGNDRMLDLMRLLYESDAYWPYLVPFPGFVKNGPIASGTTDPNGYVANFNSGQTQTGIIQVPANSFLVSAGAATFSGAGFKLRVYDKTTQSDLFYQQFAQYKIFSDGDLNLKGQQDQPFGPYIVTSPIIIQSPGIIQIEITNLDNANAELIQCLLSFAVPKGSIANNVVAQQEG